MSMKRTHLWFAVVMCALALAPAMSGQSTVSWAAQASGSWQVGSNWSTGVVPGPSDDVVIDRPESLTITISTGAQAVKSLVCNEALTISGGSLSVQDPFQVNNTFTLSGGSLLKCTVLPPLENSTRIVVSGSSALVGVLLNADLSNRRVPRGEQLLRHYLVGT